MDHWQLLSTFMLDDLEQHRHDWHN